MNDHLNSRKRSSFAATRVEKRRNFSRKVLSSVEIVFEDPSEDKSTSATNIAWKVFKCIVFFVCLAYLIMQSAEFYYHYLSYPTNSHTHIEYLKGSSARIKLPAFTLCYRNRISAQAFCEMYPNLCEKPKDVEKYCLKHQRFCPKNISTLVIPKHGYFTNFSKEVLKMSQGLLFNRSDDIPSHFLDQRRVTVSFVHAEKSVYVKCFSENLLLYQSDREQETRIINPETSSILLAYRYNLNLYEEESFMPWGQPQAFFHVHSPFSPTNPVYEGHPLRSGFRYVAVVKFEEDHLLPSPYATNCMDYDIQLDDTNEEEPRSQEMCIALCKSKFFKQCFGCNMGLGMHFDKEYICPGSGTFAMLQKLKASNNSGSNLGEKKDGFVGCNNSSLTERELSDVRHACLMGCNPDCLKLRYPYTVFEAKKERDPETGNKDKRASIAILLKHLDAKIFSHEPFYTAGELFSYIGGLVGCWLGISVWAFSDIFEKSVKKVTLMGRNYRRKKNQL